MLGFTYRSIDNSYAATSPESSCQHGDSSQKLQLGGGGVFSAGFAGRLADPRASSPSLLPSSSLLLSSPREEDFVELGSFSFPRSTKSVFFLVS